MKARFAGRLYISKSSCSSSSSASPEVTKGSGLTFLAEHLGFTPERRPPATARMTERSSGPRSGQRAERTAGARGRRLACPRPRRRGSRR